MEDWEFSSFRIILNIGMELFVIKLLAKQLLDLPANVELFYETSYQAINEIYLLY